MHKQKLVTRTQSSVLAKVAIVVSITALGMIAFGIIMISKEINKQNIAINQISLPQDTSVKKIENNSVKVIPTNVQATVKTSDTRSSRMNRDLIQAIENNNKNSRNNTCSGLTLDDLGLELIDKTLIERATPAELGMEGIDTPGYKITVKLSDKDAPGYFIVDNSGHTTGTSYLDQCEIICCSSDGWLNARRSNGTVLFHDDESFSCVCSAPKCNVIPRVLEDNPKLESAFQRFIWFLTDLFN